jgi:hypothetical protein
LTRAEKEVEALDRDTAELVRKTTMLQMEENIDAAFQSFGEISDDEESEEGADENYAHGGRNSAHGGGKRNTKSNNKKKNRMSFSRPLMKVGQQKKFARREAISDLEKAKVIMMRKLIYQL